MYQLKNKIALLVALMLLLSASHAQQTGATKKANLELVKLATFDGLTYFIDTDTKDTVVYDVSYMTVHQEHAYLTSKDAMAEIYAYCMFSNTNCAFYGQKYIADLVYTKVQKDIYNGTAWVLSPPKNEWVITTLNRNPEAIVPAIVYADIKDPLDEDESVTLVMLVMGNTSYRVDTVTEKEAKFTQWAGLGVCDLRMENKFGYKDADKRYYLLEKKYNSDVYTDYYQLTIKKYNGDAIEYIKTVKFDMKGNELKDRFDLNSNLAATLKFVNNKLTEANGHQVGTIAKTISVVNSFSIKDNKITYIRKWGNKPGNKNCSESTYETLFTDTYVFPIADIDDVQYGENKEGNATGFFRIYLKEESCKKYESYYECEKNDKGIYEWNRIDQGSKMIKSLIVYFMRGEENSFENIKKAIFHLKDL